jgi:hypothetical protein
MLSAVENDTEEELIWWARWKRLGCPTTSNAAESIDALINELTRRSRSFFHSLKIIRKRLWQRFDQRNFTDRRANRSINNIQKKWDKLTPGNQEFYQELTRFGREGDFAPAEWQFPRIRGIPTEFPPAEWLIIKEGLPPQWVAQAAEKKPARMRAEEERKKEKDPDAPAPLLGSDSYVTAGKLILRSVKLISGSRKAGTRLYGPTVWKHGEALGFAHQETIAPAEETAWRFAVYTELGLLRPVKTKTKT